MSLDYIITDNVGLVHLICCVVALGTGSLILGMTKGTTIHKKIGYLYSVSMLVVLVTAFTMYNRFRTWGLFLYQTKT